MKLTTADLQEKLQAFLQHTLTYAWLICLVGVVAIYGFLVWRIGTLSNIQPNPADVSAQIKSAQVPHIDQNALKKIQDLQDNSVSVQALFNDARNNPFHE
jgi:nitrate reductase NapE component